ncbi:MAG: TonB-dependent receptor plug domain-containing protein [Saprospiraceae bacterium]|nr:TonB-dependent receptor plug domain-containing protein [Saprospiraceae bacterium]
MKKPFLLTLISFWAIGNLVAQSTFWTIDVQPEDDLKKIIEVISARQPYLIAYPTELANLRSPVTGHLEASSLEELLQQIFPKKIEVKKLDATKYLIRDQGIVISNYKGDHIISGKIVDLKNEAIPDVLIYQDNENPAITDKEGKFSLEIPSLKKSVPVYFQSLGYATISLTPDQIMEEPIIALEDQPLQLQTVTIIDQLPILRSRSDKASLEIKNNPQQSFALSSLNASDLIKQIQMLPGVQSDDDLNAQIRIRGSEGNESLVLLDGIPVYRTDHFYGIFGATNGNYFSQGSLYKNALPSQYGGRTGGLLTLNSTSDSQQWNASMEVDLLTASVSLFTPISKKISWNLGVRSSYLNAADLSSFDLTQGNIDFYGNDDRVLPRSENITTNPQFNFQDINSKISLFLSDRLNIDFNFFGSSDQLQNNYDLSYFSRNNGLETITFRNLESWQNLGSSYNLHWKLNRRWQFFSNAFFSHYNSETDIVAPLRSNFQQGALSGGGSYAYLIRDTDNESLKLGIDYKINRTHYQFIEDEQDLLLGSELANQATLFGEKTWFKNKTTSLILGGRGTYYSPTKQLYFDPKLQINHYIGDAFQLKTSIHYAHQFTRELNYENRLGQSTNYLLMANGKEYPVGTSLQYMVGCDFKKDSWLLDIELYQKNLGGILEYSLQKPAVDTTQGVNRSRSYKILSGEGKVIGLDLLLSKTTKKYAGWIAYTLSKSTRQFKEIRFNQPFPAENDRRHQFKWVNTYHLGKFSFSANYIYSSGKPYLALNELPEETDRRDLDGDSYLENLPSYQRLDLGVDFHFNLMRKKGTIGISCFNVTNHTNVKYLQYIYSIPLEGPRGQQLNTVVGAETSLLKRTPNLKFRIDL